MKNQELKNITIERPGDLAPRGIKYTIKGNYTFNEVFEHIYLKGLGIKQRRK
jgi:hypothetical protein